jgi:hypothetical protein
MQQKLAANDRHFTAFRPHYPKIVRHRTILYGSSHEDILALALALTGIALTTVFVVSMLVAFSRV